MPIKIPTLDERKYQDLLNEALARIPVHNPEWTNFNNSDPGVTLVQVFSFLTENLLYRANQIPERNRRKFLSLLGIPFQPAAPAQGLATFSNERGVLQTVTLNGGLDVRAGQVPFRTGMGLDVLPVEAKVYYKQVLQNPVSQQQAYYQQLYLSFLPADQASQADLTLYETVAMPDPSPGSSGVDLNSTDVVDGLWIALLARTNDKPYAENVKLARQAIGGKTLSLGIVPWLPGAARSLMPAGRAPQDATSRLQFSIPIGGLLPASRIPSYRPLPAEFSGDILNAPGVVQIELPDSSALQIWSNIDPLEWGAGQFPPPLEDTQLAERLVTWLHVTAPAGVVARLFWLGINATTISQGASVSNERLPDGSGEPDQVITLSHAPVIPGTVSLRVTTSAGQASVWSAIDDLISAGPEVPGPDPRLSPGAWQPPSQPSEKFQLDAEAGRLTFGDGVHGKRPPQDATLRADYVYSVGAAGNLGAGSVNTCQALPAGFKVNNPVATWGGSDAETQPEAEKHIPAYLQHRDRLVTVSDFETITWRTPGIDLGRVEVIPAFHPKQSLAPGDAPGMVTLMLIPSTDPDHPEAPSPDQNFLKAVCNYLDPRRLVTTELYLCGPIYIPLWISIGIQIQPGSSVAEVRERVKAAIKQFISPLPAGSPGMPTADASLPAGSYSSGVHGWPLSKSVVDIEVATVAGRVPGVLSVTGVLLLRTDRKTNDTSISMDALLNLPQLLGVSVSIGDPLTRDQLGVPDGTTAATTGVDTSGQPPSKPNTTPPLPVPVIPEECK